MDIGAGLSPEVRSQVSAVAQRYNREYQGEAVELPPEVAAMPIAQERAAGLLPAKLASPFWQLAQPKKNQHCLDIGCGVGFLLYPWRDWNAFFHGQEISTVARDVLVSRGPQLNSKLFKGVRLAAAHQLDYEPASFDLAIATGVSCYYPREYWEMVLAGVKKLLKPGGFFLFDTLEEDRPLAENWSILEMYLGAEVFPDTEANWKTTIKAAGGRLVKTLPGEIFRLYKVGF